MKSSRRPAAALAGPIALLAALLAALPAPARSAGAADARQVETQIEERLSSMGRGFDPASYVQTASDLAQRLEIEPPPTLDFDPEGRRLTLADGSPADLEVYRLELSGSAPFSKVYNYLNDFWAFGYSGVKLEELRVEAQPGNLVDFRARYAVADPTLPVVPFPKKPTPEHLERRRLSLQLLDELAKDGLSRGLLDSLGFLAEKLNPVAVGFSRVELKDGKGTIEGAALGPSATEALAAALEESGLVAAKVVLQPPFRVCRSFTATFAPGGQAPEDAYMYFSYNGLFDAGIPALCGPSAPAREIQVAGKAGAAGIDLELRDVPLLDALAILADLTGEGFVAGPGLPAVRVSLAARGASSSELLAALREAGVEVAPGSPHWVVPAGGKAPALPKGGEGEGEKVYFSQRSGTLKDLACKLYDATGKGVWTAAPLDAEVIAFAGLPWEKTLGAVLAPHGLIAAAAGERIVIGPGPAEALAGREDLTDLCSQEYTGEPATTGSRLADMEFSEGTLKLEDFELAGFGKKGGEYFGVVFYPNRTRPRLATESVWLGDGMVTVGQGGVKLEREDGSTAVLKWP